MYNLQRLALITLITVTTLTSQVTCKTLKFDALPSVATSKQLRHKNVEVIDMKDSALLCLRDDCRKLTYVFIWGEVTSMKILSYKWY